MSLCGHKTSHNDLLLQAQTTMSDVFWRVASTAASAAAARRLLTKAVSYSFAPRAGAAVAAAVAALVDAILLHACVKSL